MDGDRGPAAGRGGRPTAGRRRPRRGERDGGAEQSAERRRQADGPSPPAPRAAWRPAALPRPADRDDGERETARAGRGRRARAHAQRRRAGRVEAGQQPGPPERGGGEQGGHCGRGGERDVAVAQPAACRTTGGRRRRRSGRRRWRGSCRARAPRVSSSPVRRRRSSRRAASGAPAGRRIRARAERGERRGDAPGHPRRRGREGRGAGGVAKNAKRRRTIQVPSRPAATPRSVARAALAA